MPTKRDLIIIGIIAFAFSVIGFSLSRLFTSSVPESKKDFEAPYKHREDSLIRMISIRDKVIDSLLNDTKAIDTLIARDAKTNKKKYVEIKNFTPTSRDRWRDSVKRANGL